MCYILAAHNYPAAVAAVPPGADMIAESPQLRRGLTRALCIVVFFVMLAALAYAASIGIINYSRIHV